MVSPRGAPISYTPLVELQLSSLNADSSHCDQRQQRCQCVLGLPTWTPTLLVAGMFIAELCANAVDLTNVCFIVEQNKGYTREVDVETTLVVTGEGVP